MSARLSVVIPAHNESAVLGRTLASITSSEFRDQLEIVVAANGCTDDTAEVARGFGVRVVELTTASKVAALNAADEIATVFPRAYVDADIDVTADTLMELADVLAAPEGPLVATPTMRVDVSRSSWAVRAHYRIWELSAFRQAGHIGSGIYALSARGRARFGRFPDVIADDRYVQQLFAPHERGTTPTGQFTMHAPRHLRALIHRSARAAAGNKQLGMAGLDGQAVGDRPSTTVGMRALVHRVTRRPVLWPAFAVYCTSYALPRVLARRRAAQENWTWARDETSRS